MTEVQAPPHRRVADALLPKASGGGRIALRDYLVYAGLVLLVLVFSVTLRHDGFMTSDNLLNIMRQTAPDVVMAVGMVFVLSAGEIDLSIGSVVGLSAVVGTKVLQHHGAVLGVAAALGVGLLVGLVNGICVTYFRLPSFLVTLAMLSLLAGLSQTATNLEPVAVSNQTFSSIFGSGSIGAVPSLLVWSLVAVAIGYFVYRHTRFGAHVLAAGDNADAAQVSGIRTNRVKIGVLVMSAMLAALAGLLYSGSLQGSNYQLGSSDLLAVIAAVVIGGTRLYGGRGSIIGAFAGCLILGVLNNGLILIGLTPSEQLVAQGALLLLAVLLTMRENRTGK
ncbi:MAG TPA: ABC transporter permease [Jatrophihabitans sp.]|nr:ABC transporter permease [Jatrophihabitans sp.]